MRKTVADTLLTAAGRASRSLGPINSVFDKVVERMLPQLTASAYGVCPGTYGECYRTCWTDSHWQCTITGNPTVTIYCAPSQYACDHDQDIVTTWGCGYTGQYPC